MNRGIPLPDPRSYINEDQVGPAVEYLSSESRDQWIATLALQSAAVFILETFPRKREQYWRYFADEELCGLLFAPAHLPRA